jgi:hypothetical protein
MTATPLTGRDAASPEARAAWSTMRADRCFLWLWLTIASSLSVGGNVGHAWLTVLPGASRWMAIGWAAAPPALLMLAIHGLPTLARMLGTDERDKLLTAVVWGVNVGAFGWSAFGIFGFTTAMGVPAQMAWVAPFVIDLSVFGATRGLVLTAPLAARMKAGVAPKQFASASADSTAVPAPMSAPANASRSDTASPQPPPLGASGGSARVPRAAPKVAPAAGPSAPETRRLAEEIVASGAVRKDVDTVAAILSESEVESRKAVIAERIGVHHTVVTKTLEAAESRRNHQLTAVS